MSNIESENSNLKNLQVLFNYRRLRDIRRTNNMPTHQTEDVAQHSFYVAILASIIAEEYNEFAHTHNLDYHPLDVENRWEYVDVEAVTRQALFHDMEEAFTSDIPWNVKHHSDVTRAVIQACVKDKLEGVYKDTSGPISKHKHTILNAKTGLDGEFVNMADSLEGAWYCYTELVMGNRYMAGLFIKYMQLISDDPLSNVLEASSSLFRDLMAVLDNMYEKVADNSGLDPGTSLILD